MLLGGVGEGEGCWGRQVHLKGGGARARGPRGGGAGGGGGGGGERFFQCCAQKVPGEECQPTQSMSG